MTRRSVLRMTTAVAGLAVAPARAGAESSGPSPAMAALSAYMSEAGSRALPADVAEQAKHHLIDTLAAMISGSQLPPGQAAARYVTAHGGKGGATVAGTMLIAAPLDAALANGVMAHADETDDSHGPSRSHPGCAIVPAALASAEELGADGTRVLRAVTLGYDVGPRVLMAMGTVGSPIQGPLDALEAIRTRQPFEAEQVRGVVVRLAPSVGKVVDNRDIPDICLQHMIAVMLIDKTVSFQAAHDKARMHDATALRERAKVRLVPDEELAKLLPVRVAVVEVELADGTRLSERVSAVRGTPRNPMARAEVIAKTRDLTAPVLGRDKADRLIETVYAIETVTDVRSLRPLLQP